MNETEIEESYREMLDDVYGEIEICGLTYAASVALERVDPIAYRVGLSDYESMVEDD